MLISELLTLFLRLLGRVIVGETPELVEAAVNCQELLPAAFRGEK